MYVCVCDICYRNNFILYVSILMLIILLYVSIFWFQQFVCDWFFWYYTFFVFAVALVFLPAADIGLYVSQGRWLEYVLNKIIMRDINEISEIRQPKVLLISQA